MSGGRDGGDGVSDAEGVVEGVVCRGGIVDCPRRLRLVVANTWLVLSGVRRSKSAKI